jgi:hypothetical protein
MDQTADEKKDSQKKTCGMVFKKNFTIWNALASPYLQFTCITAQIYTSAQIVFLLRDD